MNATQVVRVVDVDGLFIESKDGREELRFRIEVRQSLAARGEKYNRPRYSARVLRLDTFRVSPSFPQRNGKPTIRAADNEMFVVDDAFANEDFRGESAQRTLDAVLKRLRSQFGN